MQKLVACPYCNCMVEMKGEFTLICTNCENIFRIRNGKTYKKEEIAPELLSYITSIFASIVRCGVKDSTEYDKFVEWFISNENITKMQFKDALKLYRDGQKSFLGMPKSSYKDNIKLLKKLIDNMYAQENRQVQEGAENNIFYLMYSLANISDINAEQEKIINFYRAIFEYTDERYEALIKTISSKNSKKEEKKTLNVDDVFNNIRESLISNFLGQDEFFTNLLVAFKRPFVLNGDIKFPKNVVCIFTTESEFVIKAISDVTNLMFQETLIQGKEEVINFEEYSDENSFEKFLSEIYGKLNSSNEVIVMKDFKLAAPNVKNIILEIIKAGEYVYNTQSGSVVISSNNKYFIFISSDEVDEFISDMGQDTFEKVTDIIKIDELSDSEIEKMIEYMVNNFITRTRNVLQIPLKYDTGILAFLKKIYTKRTGLKGISIYLEQTIYKPLTEFKLKRTAQLEDDVVLCVVNDEPAILVENNILMLQKFNYRQMDQRVEEVKRKLNKIIGLKPVKEYVLKLEDSATTKTRREEMGLKTSSLSMNMIFTGNPGTGKTTIARIVAEFLAAVGILQKGQLVEVSRGDLVGEHVGETAKKTSGKINEALGGVLFIDEAYSLCRDKRDTFGLEAIDTLVKMMEDNKDKLVVILAGYSDEMNEFLKNNSGLKSRFPNIIEFPDYTPEEMYRIANEIAQSGQYVIDDTCIEPLIAYFESKNIKGRNDAGNGRLARNIVEKAILNQSRRIIQENGTDYELLKLSDFELEEKAEFDLEEHLKSIIGLENVKDFLRKQYNVIKAQEKRKEAGIVTDVSQSLNMIFTGNPGTGKTTIARVVAEMLKEIGVLKSGQLIEADRSKLVAEYVGQTSVKTTEIFKSALGGVLFIDEAYALSTSNDNFGKEAIDTLVKLIEDYRGEIVVILAGYEKEMKDFLNVNSGLESRFPLVINFPDYSSNELFSIFKNMIQTKGFTINDECAEVALNKISMMHKKATASSGNGRMVRNFVDEIIRNQSDRVSKEDILLDDINKITVEDLGENEELNNIVFDYEAEFEKIIGLETVKNYIRGLAARIKITNERKKLGLKVNDTQTLHMIFTGNPGTGKTMMARTVAKLLYSMGIIEQDKFVETDRAGLVAGYVGQTAIKTTEKIKEAFGGVLFIDEAYTLSQGGANDFGKEAIDTLLKLMDDNRDKLIVILAGYTNEMKEFLDVNPGLNSRFPNIVEFEDYSLEELMEIANKMFAANGYELTEEAKEKLNKVLQEAKKNSRFGNGRYVRNILEKSINNQAMRVNSLSCITKDVLVSITKEDISAL